MSRKEYMKTYLKRYHIQKRQQVVDAYGGRCEVCGITELRFLTLDHSFQDGAEHRRRVGKDIYTDIIKRGFPKDEGYRVLCWNHNCAKQYSNKDTRQVRYRKKLKFKVVQHYGGKCACCGEDRLEFLTVDHKNGGGNKYRRNTKKNSSAFYSWLRREGYPLEYQVLCFNCNCGKEN